MAQLNTRIVLRNDSTTKWLQGKDQVLLKGEVGIEFLESDKVKMKIGDGITTWENLPYFGGGESGVQPDWNQNDSTAKDYIKNKPAIATDDNVMDFLAEMGIVTPVTNSSGEILISSSNEIYSL